MLKRFSVKDLILIAALAAIGIAIKPIVGPVTKIFSTPLGIPGGSFAGGFYLMWLVLAVMIVNKAFAGTLFGVLQAIGVMIFPFAGNQGAISLITYTVPGLLADLIFFLFLYRKHLLVHMTMCAGTNIAGAVISAILIFRHPPLILLAISGMALVSGAVGGYLSYSIYYSLKKMRII